MIRAPALVGVLAAAYGAVKGRGGSDSADAARTEAGKLALIVSHRLQSAPQRIVDAHFANTGGTCCSTIGHEINV